MSENGAGHPIETAARETTIRDVFAATRRRRGAALAIFAVVLAVGTWKTMTEERIYATPITVRVQQQSQVPLQGVPVSTPDYDFRVDPLVSEQQVIKSKLIATRTAEVAGSRLVVVQPAHLLLSDLIGDNPPVVTPQAPNGDYRLTLTDSTYLIRQGTKRYGPVRYGVPLAAGDIAITIPSRPAVKAHEVVLRVASLDAVAQELQSLIATRVLPQTDIIEITVFGRDPVRVKNTANDLARVYADYSKEQGLVIAQARTSFIRSALSEQGQQLGQAQDSLRRFQEHHQSSDVSAEATAILQAIYQYETQRGELTLQQHVYQQLVGKLEQTDTTDIEMRRLVGTDAVKDNRAVADLYQRWFDLERTRQQLMLTRNSKNRDVQAIDSTVAATKSNLKVASGLYLQSLATRIASIDTNIADLRQKAEQFPPLVAQQARLAENVHTMESGYENLLGQYQLSRIGESAETGRVRVIDAAVLPTIPVSPHRKRSVFLAAVIGIALAIAGAALLDRFDDSVQTPDEIRDRLRLPLLGSIPRVRNAPPHDAARLVTHVEPQSLVAEAFRSLRTNIAFARAHQDLRTIVVTSAAPGDGKSTIAVNLATTFAQQGQRTLLIDADLRRAVIDRTFDLPRSPGLTEFLVGSHTLEAVARETDVPNLYILPSGHFPPNPSELLGSQPMRAGLEAATKAFDMVVIDSPPVLAVTDASVLSALVDGTIIVVRLGVSAREAVSRSVAQLRVVNGRILGAVLNAVDFRSSGYHGGYGYYYQQFYGNESGDRGKKRGKRRASRVG
ncbi:MAG TPA: polysaccharide biosynthesis tyrosine autokinase [Gemmatimonadaceae bacterium]|nr:polysaccharide biosynthesis tyrosine autokinase [Gemmatimonadaceae bacterium]